MQASQPTAKTASKEPVSAESRLAWLTQYGSIIDFVLLCVALTFLSKYFLTPENISNIVLQMSINGILAMGMALVILAGVLALVSKEQTWQRSQAGALVRTGFGEREAND